MSTIHYRSFASGWSVPETPRRNIGVRSGIRNRGSRRNARSCRARYARSCCVRDARSCCVRYARSRCVRFSLRQDNGGQPQKRRRQRGIPTGAAEGGGRGPPTSRDTRGNGDGGRDSPTSERFRGSSEDAEGDQGGRCWVGSGDLRGRPTEKEPNSGCIVPIG